MFDYVVNGQGERRDLALLSITAGFFARLSLDSASDIGFSEISELTSVAQNLFKVWVPLTTTTVPNSAANRGSISLSTDNEVWEVYSAA